MSRQTIAIDIDDVLSASAAGFSAYSNRRWGTTTKPEDYTEAWADFWQVPVEVAVARADDFHKTDAIYYYDHFKEAPSVLRSLRKRFDLVIVTSRREVLKPLTDKWLEERFSGIFNEVHYVGIWDTDDHTHHKLNQTKAEFCREIGALYLIDDQVKHCVAAHEAGITSLLFGDYAWSRNDTVPKGVVRVADWAAVERFFDAKS